MDYHHHARLTIYSREQLAKSVVQGRLSLREAAGFLHCGAQWLRRVIFGFNISSSGTQVARAKVVLIPQPMLSQPVFFSNGCKPVSHIIFYEFCVQTLSREACNLL